MKIARVAALAFLALASLASADAQSSEPPFASEIYLFGVEDEIFPPESCATLFVGSSSIRFWFTLAKDFPSRAIIRRGYGGSTIADSNYYFDRVVAPYKPREIVFYAGENDINAGRSPEEVLAEFETFMAKKSEALGDTPVFFLSIKPSKARIGELEAQTKANALIAEYAGRRPDLAYVDVASSMLDHGVPKDIFISDGLHMNREGYAMWRDRIRTALKTERVTRAPGCK
jgi:lysophospholipase L1-like esterase